MSTNFSLYAETYGEGFGQDRFEKATAKLEETGGILTEPEAMTLLRDVRINGYTCWSVVYNLDDLHANIVFRSEYQSETYGYRI